MTIVKLTKLKDEKFNGFHPNGILEGDVFKGVFNASPEIGERFNIKAISFRPKERGLSTSPVTEILPNNTFRTENSLYKYEIIEQN